MLAPVVCVNGKGLFLWFQQTPAALHAVRGTFLPGGSAELFLHLSLWKSSGPQHGTTSFSSQTHGELQQRADRESLESSVWHTDEKTRPVAPPGDSWLNKLNNVVEVLGFSVLMKSPFPLCPTDFAVCGSQRTFSVLSNIFLWNHPHPVPRWAAGFHCPTQDLVVSTQTHRTLKSFCCVPQLLPWLHTFIIQKTLRNARIWKENVSWCDQILVCVI